MQLEIFNEVIGTERDAIEQALIDMGLHTVVRTMRRISVAEREMNKLCEICPERSAIIKDGFRYLAPHPVMYDKGRRLYALHCRIMLARILAGEDLSPGTDAEVLAALSNASLHAPLTGEFTTAYSRLFHKHVKDLVPEGHDLDIPEYNYEPYPGRCEEIYSDLREKLSMQRDIHRKSLSKN